ncbi:MAG TPA: glycosyltransferase [Actinomycetota bacterium]
MKTSREPQRPATPALGVLVRGWPRLSQTFVLDEVLALERLGLRLRIFALTSTSTEALTQPELTAVRAPVEYLDGGTPRRRTAVAAHLRALLASPPRYLATAWYVARHPEWDRGYHAASRGRCLTLAATLAATLRRAGREGEGGAVGRLHAHFAHDPALVALLTHRLTGIPWSFTAHARDLFQVPPAAVADRVAAAEAVVTCCGPNADYLRDVLGDGLGERVRLIHHGVDVEAFQPATGHGPGRNREGDRDAARDAAAPRIVSVGRLVEKKGFADLLAACHRLKQRGQRFHLELYGDGPLGEELAATVDRLGLGDEVVLAGSRTRPELRAALRRADLFALTPFVTADGDRDGIPNVLLEAMACGLPVVSTTVAGVTEVMRHGADGLLAPPRDVDAIADHLAVLLADERLRARLGGQARRTVVERFDGRDAAATLAALLAPASVSAGGSS